jgi:hypothetical protein
VVDGVGVTTEEGDVVGAAVGLGVLVLDAGIVGVIRAVGVGVAADSGGEGTDLAAAVGRVRGVETVAAHWGPTSR